MIIGAVRYNQTKMFFDNLGFVLDKQDWIPIQSPLPANTILIVNVD